MAINYLAVLVAAVASWMVGGAWYGVLGKQWMAALGWTDVDRKAGMAKGPMITSFIAEIIMAVMLTGLMVHLGSQGVRAGLIAGLLVWIGFVATTITVNNAFQKRSIMLTVIDAGHWLLVLVVQGVVLGLMA